jgi:hypothetical protein
MNKYTWKITSIETLSQPVAPINNCVVFVQYTVSATNDSVDPITVSLINSSTLGMPSSKDNLLPYEKLTEKEVLSWIQSEPNLVENIQANLDLQIQSLISTLVTPISTPLPWNKS